MLPAIPTSLDEYDRMTPESPCEEQLAVGVTFAKFPHYIKGSDSAGFVNAYTIEIEKSHGLSFGMLFSECGDYCPELAARAESQSGGVLCAMNCNFGLVTDDPSVLPKDITYNLHVERCSIYQLPSADKTALLIDESGQLDFKFLTAQGNLKIRGRWFPWQGSLTKSRAATPETDALIVYGPFNVRLVRVKDAVTGSRQVCDADTLSTPRRHLRTDICLQHNGHNLIVANKVAGGGSSIFDYHMVLSADTAIAEKVCLGDTIEDATIDGVHLSRFTFGASTGAILERDRIRSSANIEASLLYQTFSANKTPIISNNPKFCRACVIKRPESHVLLLADARKGIPGQEGLTVEELMNMIDSIYPDHLGFTNVDGGHAAKLAIKRAGGWDIFGNLHYKIWPRNPGDDFVWDGYRGRKLPAMLYVRR